MFFFKSRAAKLCRAKKLKDFFQFNILLIDVPLHIVIIIIRSLKLPVKDHVLPRRQTSDEYVILRTHAYVGLATLLAV